MKEKKPMLALTIAIAFILAVLLGLALEATDPQMEYIRLEAEKGGIAAQVIAEKDEVLVFDYFWLLFEGDEYGNLADSQGEEVSDTQYCLLRATVILYRDCYPTAEKDISKAMEDGVVLGSEYDEIMKIRDSMCVAEPESVPEPRISSKDKLKATLEDYANYAAPEKAKEAEEINNIQYNTMKTISGIISEGCYDTAKDDLRQAMESDGYIDQVEYREIYDRHSRLCCDYEEPAPGQKESLQSLLAQ